MSIGTIETIIGRISAATQDSQIAVFVTSDCFKDRTLDAKFANTVKTLQKIDNNDPKLVGCFDCSMDEYKVREALKAALRGDSERCDKTIEMFEG